MKKAAKKPEGPEQQFIYAFELIRHYPNARTYLVKGSLNPSMKDTLLELFFGRKKER